MFVCGNVLTLFRGDGVGAEGTLWSGSWDGSLECCITARSKSRLCPHRLRQHRRVTPPTSLSPTLHPRPLGPLNSRTKTNIQPQSLRTLPRNPQLHRPTLPRRGLPPRRPQHHPTPPRRRPASRRSTNRPPRHAQDKFHGVHPRREYCCKTRGTVLETRVVGVGREGSVDCA